MKIRPEVLAVAVLVERTMQNNYHDENWKHYEMSHLLGNLRISLDNLQDSLHKGPIATSNAASSVACYALMVANNMRCLNWIQDLIEKQQKTFEIDLGPEYTGKERILEVAFKGVDGRERAYNFPYPDGITLRDALLNGLGRLAQSGYSVQELEAAIVNVQVKTIVQQGE